LGFDVPVFFALDEAGAWWCSGSRRALLMVVHRHLVGVVALGHHGDVSAFMNRRRAGRLVLFAAYHLDLGRIREMEGLVGVMCLTPAGAGGGAAACWAFFLW